MDRDEREEQNLITRRNTVLGENAQNTANGLYLVLNIWKSLYTVRVIDNFYSYFP